MNIVITARDFSVCGIEALERLRQKGYNIINLTEQNMGSGTTEDAVLQAVRDAEVVIAGMEPFSEKILSACPHLKMISRRGIGYDSVDTAACRKYGVTLSRTAGVVEGAVAEHILAYILYFARRIDLQNRDMQKGLWNRIRVPGAKGRTLGLVGFGGIGKETALRAAALGMRVLYYCRHPKKEWETEYGARYESLDELLKQSDYVSVNVPLTEKTRGMFDKKRFLSMKQGSIFINTARGAVADAQALKEVLDEGWIWGAAVDVFEQEPCTDSPLIGCTNAVLTPHTASYTEENFITMNRMAVQNVLDFLEKRLSNKNKVV